MPWMIPAAIAGGNIVGGLLSGNAAKDAAATQAAAQLDAAKIAADAAKFRPVGVTTGFGTSNFTTDPKTGYVTGAGYTLTPEMQRQQDQLLATSKGMLNQFGDAVSTTAPLGTAANTAMTLGQGYLATTPQEQAAKYMADQQALLQPGRAEALAALNNQQAQQGRSGIAIGGGNGMMATNPEMAAYYNSLSKENLGLAASATQGGMDYAKFGAGMVGAGGDLLKQMYGTQTAAFSPYQTALGGVSTIEGLGQNALDLGMTIGGKTTAANTNSGELLANGMANAAKTIAPANAYSPWANILSGASSALNNYAGSQGPGYQVAPGSGSSMQPTSSMWGGGSAPTFTSAWNIP